MDIKKFAPWNWFRDEEKAESAHMPVKAREADGMPTQLMELHNELDRVFDRAWKSFGLPRTPALPGFSGISQDHMLLKPSVDISATDNRYFITVEVPGVEEEDIKLELVDDTLTIKGSKRQESSEKEKDYFRVERAYGAFQRVLSLPEDAGREDIDAQFDNGVLTITMPRKAEAKRRGKVIDIRPAA